MATPEHILRPTPFWVFDVSLSRNGKKIEERERVTIGFAVLEESKEKYEYKQEF